MDMPTIEWGEFPGITCGEFPGITCGEFPGRTCGEFPGITWSSFSETSSDPVAPKAKELDTTNAEAARKSTKVAIRAALVFFIAITFRPL